MGRHGGQIGGRAVRAPELLEKRRLIELDVDDDRCAEEISVVRQ